MTKVTGHNNARHFEVLVIGAGMSGLACASRLYQHEHFKKPGKLIVLEGRERIGGRIESVFVNGSRLDTGANWIHGTGTTERPNPLMELMANKRCRELSGSVAFKAPAKRKSPDGVHKDGTVMETSTTKLNDQVVPSKISSIISSGLWETLGSVNALAIQVSPEKAKETTVLQAITEAEPFRETYQNLPAEYHCTFGSMFQFVENMEAGPLTEQSTERPEGRPCMSLLEYAIKDFGGDQVFVLDGYIAIIEDLARDLLKGGHVELNTEITQIDWTGKPIRIQAGATSYTADTVLCTIPLGVLKDQRSLLFEPALPDDKEQAIQKVGYGTLDKIFLVYDEPWWNKEPYLTTIKRGIVKTPSSPESDLATPDSFMGFTEELPGYEIHKDGTVSNGPCDISLINLHNLSGTRALCCFVSCSTAVRIEQMTNDKAGEIFHRALSSWFGQETPKPAAVHVTRWSQDRFSKGSYSHMIAGVSEAAHRETFEQPVTNSDGAVLRFAGEHTSRDYYATAHTALISGRREADAILKQMSLVG